MIRKSGHQEKCVARYHKSILSPRHDQNDKFVCGTEYTPQNMNTFLCFVCLFVCLFLLDYQLSNYCGLLPSCNNPLAQPMLTQICITFWGYESILQGTERFLMEVNYLMSHDAYMRQWTGTLLCLISSARWQEQSQCWLIFNWTHRNKFLGNVDRNIKFDLY